MSLVNTQPAAISAAATQLEGIGNSFAAESAAAATSTTDVVPAASDEVSILQAGVFSTYGQLYQSVSAQAQAIHQQFTNLLNQSSRLLPGDRVGQPGRGRRKLAVGRDVGRLVGRVARPPDRQLAQHPQQSAVSGSILNSNISNLGNIQVGNCASAGSDLIGMGGGGLLTALAGPATAGADIGGLGSRPGRQRRPRSGGIGGAGAMGAAPVLAAAGEGSSIGALSVPPSWAGGAGIPAASTPVTLASQSWAAAPAGDGGRDERHRRHARGRQRRSRRLELRSPALRRQAQGHAGGSQADTHLEIQRGQRWPAKPPSTLTSN